ncbi:MAG: cyclic 2,3-diphosphoglycerate synthetase [Thermoplasmatota archaeon]
MDYEGLDESLHMDSSYLRLLDNKDVLCLVDGQHYPPVTKWTIEKIEKVGANIVGILFLGGTEKVKNAVEELGGGGKYKLYIDEKKKGLPLSLLNKALEEVNPDIVIDLSDEPVVDYGDRFKLASLVISHDVIYYGSDFMFSPPKRHDILDKPSFSIIGTGKRVGKTAISVSIARIMKENSYDPVIVCMGRGGPPDPVHVDVSRTELNADTLLNIARGGQHAASDYWEDALLAQVPTIGCRRCGGGMTGNPFSSNVLKGAEMTNEIPQDFVIMEGSGPTFPPVKTDENIVIIGAGQPIRNIKEYFGEYRLKISKLAIVTMCEEPMVNEKKLEKIKKGILKINPDIKLALTIFRPQPLSDIKGKKVFLTTTAPEKVGKILVDHLEKEHDCEVVGVSNKLSNRPELKKDLDEGLEKADVLLTEIKAASIDMAAMMASENDVEIVFMHNQAEVIGGNVESIEKEIVSICESILSDRGEKT